MRVSVLGAAGYIGGELLRLLFDHPRIELVQATSDRFAGKPISHVHPNLRGMTEQRFIPHDRLQPVDILLMALDHGKAITVQTTWDALAPIIIDLSGDFRLRDPEIYQQYYGSTHESPALLKEFVSGIPEIYRTRLSTANRIAVAGCMATPAILALYPFARAELVKGDIFVDARTGSSGSGAVPSMSSHHPERSGAMRVFMPIEHRHEAEISQVCRRPVRMSATGVEAVRGVQIIARATLREPLTDQDVRALYRECYDGEPFVRIVKRETGRYRLPEPKLLLGTNFCDLGFALTANGHQIVLIGAVDNLMKGGAGAAVQCLNIRAGFDEREGLRFRGLHPL